MNKYQLKALTLFGVKPENFGRVISKKTGSLTNTLAIKDDSITIRGDRDIFSKDYSVRLYLSDYIKVYLLTDGKWMPLEASVFSAMDKLEEEGIGKQIKGVVFDVNLDSKPTKLKLVPPGEVVDDVVLEVKYDLMSEEDYWAMMNSPEMLRKNMNVTFRTGENLVNIYWKHAKENLVASVRIDLYLKSGDDRQLMGKYKATDEVFFKSIDGLAYGSYVFELFQFDKEGNEVASSGLILFTIEKPKAPDQGGGQGGLGRNGRWKNTVVIG